MVEDPAAACPQAQWIWIHSDAAAIAKLLRLVFQTQSRSVRRFDCRFGLCASIAMQGAYFENQTFKWGPAPLFTGVDSWLD